MRRGEVRWYRFASPNKRRPVVILTRARAIEYMDEVTVAPITSRVRDIPTEVALGVEDGMPTECVVNLDHVQTVSKGKLGAAITLLGAVKLAQLKRALLFALEM